MRVNAWNPPASCYRYVARGVAADQCPSALWFWLALAAAGMYILVRR